MSKYICLPLLIFFFLCFATLSESEEDKTRKAAILEIEGPIGPATADYIKRGIIKAAQNNSSLIVIQINTPGGLDTSMRSIIKAILTSPVPVAGFVYPSGSRAASAGTYILYACHLSAMAPATNIGAATPVSIGTLPIPDLPEKDPDKKDKKPVTKPKSSMEKKIINDAVAYIRGLADKHGRNEEWAIKAVKDGASIPAGEALELNVIDIVAESLPDLFRQINGKTVTVNNDKILISTDKIVIERYETDWRTRLLGVITNPNVAYILMLIGIYGLIFEFANPGAVIPGIAGIICLLLALYAFQVLPINYAGLGLILVGIALMVTEAFLPSFGAIGIGGVIAFIIGSVILIDTELPGFGISPVILITFAAVSAGFTLLIIGAAVKARLRPGVSSEMPQIGELATVLSDFTNEGQVLLNGEIWQVTTNAPLRKGQQVKVVGNKGLILVVGPVN